MGYIVLFIIIATLAALAIATIKNSNRKGKLVMELKQEYEQLLKGSDKRAALKTGRIYYSALKQYGCLSLTMNR